MGNRIKKIRTIEYSIRFLRLEKEIEYERKKVEKSAPKAVVQSENFFSKLGKNTVNAFTRDSFAEHSRCLEEAKEAQQDLFVQSKEEDVTIIENIDELKKLINETFEDDKFGLNRLELEMNIVMDNTFEYSQDEETFKIISQLFSGTLTELNELSDNMQKSYVYILNDKSENLKKAVMVASFAAIPFLVLGTVTFIGNLAISAAIGAVATTTVVGMAAVGGVTYYTLNEIQKDKLKSEFASLTVEQTAVSLVRTIMSLKQINNYYNDKEGKKLYDSYIDNYIDLKSDLDLRLFMEKEDIESNSKKNDMFHNADTYLKKVLKLEVAK